MPMQNLSLGLCLQASELLAQPGHGLTELAEVKLDRMNLLVEPRLKNADLAGFVQQLVE
jgi:hypothetical protein